MNYSIIIPNYNGVNLIGPCLDSLKTQTLPPMEVIVVDDASHDSSVQFVEQHYPWVKQIVRKRNGGFTAACNDGFDAAKGEVVILFNNDAEATPKWLAELDQVYQAHPEIAVLASKILTFDKPATIHSAGDYYRTDGLPGNRGVWQKDTGQYDRLEEVLGPCGAVAAFRQEAVNAVRSDNPNGRVLDEYLFMYLEDTDLDLRLRLRGYRCLYVPTAIVYHQVSATAGGKLSHYQYMRNLLLIAAKNLPLRILLANLPFILALQLILLVRAIVGISQPNQQAALRGQIASWRALPYTLLKQRGRVQRAKTVSDEYFKSFLWYNFLLKRLYRRPFPPTPLERFYDL